MPTKASMPPGERADCPPAGSPLGDSLRALHALRPGDWWAGAAIVQRLGLSSAAGAGAGLGRSAPVVTELPELSAQPPEPEPLPPQRLRPVHDDEALQPPLPASLEPLDDGDGAGSAAPDWLHEVALVPQPAQAANPFRGEHLPLFAPRWQRAILTRLAASTLPAGEMDLSAIVAQVARGQPLRQVPRRPMATSVKGLRLLIDRGEGMQPFHQDVAELVRALVRTLGPTRLRVERFRGLPSWGLEAGLDAADFRPSPPGMALLVLTDLGLPPQPTEAPRVGAHDWLRFLQSMRRQGQPSTLLVPRSAAQLPEALRRVARLVPWDRRTLASRLAEPGAALWTPDAQADAPAPVLDAIAALDPATRALASASALATRVEPRLLRQLRLMLADTTGPDHGMGVHTEARLWFSPLVAERGPTGFTLLPAARDGLLRLLRRERSDLHRAWAVVAAAHVDSPPALQMEEAASFHWLNDDPAAARQVLRSLVATLVAPQRSGSWRWATQAVLRLPRALLAMEEAQMLALGAAARSGEPQTLAGLAQPSGGAWHWLRPPLAQREVAVTLRPGAIEFAPRPTGTAAGAALLLRVPDQPVVLLNIRAWGDDPAADAAPATTLRLNPQRRMLVPVPQAVRAFEIGVVGAGRYLLQAVQQQSKARQKFIQRNRQPRVNISYEVELYGALKPTSLPFVLGVLADLSGPGASTLPPLAERKFLEFDIDNVDDRLAAVQPRLKLKLSLPLLPPTWKPTLSPSSPPMSMVSLVVERMQDFEPGQIARQVPELAPLWQDRADLQHLARQLEAQPGARRLPLSSLQNQAVLALRASTTADVGAGLAGLTVDGQPVLQALARSLGLDAGQAGEDAARAVWALAQQGLDSDPDLATGSALDWARQRLAELDAALAPALNAILHHPDFQRLEATWRGLLHLVTQAETDETLKLRVLNISRPELQRTLRRYTDSAWDQSPLFKRIVEEEFGQLGGEPFGALVVDQTFDHTAVDVDMLRGLARIGAAAQAPFLCAAAPSLLQCKSWPELDGVRDPSRLTQTTEYAAWRALRDSADARFLVLAMPRFLARLPSGGGPAVDAFDFSEDTGSGGPECFVWANAAYAVAANLCRSFRLTGWLAQIRGVESGGVLDGIGPWSAQAETGPASGAVTAPVVGPLEAAISDRREAELAALGLLPLVPLRGGVGAVVISVPTLARPPDHDDPQASAQARLATRLNVLLPSWRFAHYLRCIARDRVGSFQTPDELRDHLQRWLLNYVDGDPENSSTNSRTRHPLAAAELVIDAPQDGAQQLQVSAYLWPHHQIEGLSEALRTRFSLPHHRPSA